MSDDYAELHCLTNFSFLVGASHPQELVAQAAELGLAALAITDRGGLYGIVQAWEMRREVERAPPLLYGSELPLYNHGNASSARAVAAVRRLRRLAGRKATRREALRAEQPDDKLVLLARDVAGYGRLSQLISRGRRRVEKGEIALCAAEARELGGAGLCVLAGGEGSRLLGLLRAGDRRAARRELERLASAFGDALYLEVTRHHRPGDRRRSRAVAELGARCDVPVVATGAALFHHRARKPLHDVLTCIREGVTLAAAGRRLLANAEHALKSPAEMHALFADLPGVVARTVEVAARCADFKLEQLRYHYPDAAVPAGEPAIDFLARLSREGLAARLGAERAAALSGQLARELSIIDQLGYAGYFITMWEVVQYCGAQGILCQGRGSAANSLVCYATAITSVRPDQIDMLFERFISVERAEPPDIDLDIEHDRREEVIQHVYGKYGRDRAAMVAEVIRYRAKSAIRDVGKAIGLPEQTVLRVGRFFAYGWDTSHGGDVGRDDAARAAGLDPEGATWRRLLGLAQQLQGFPRHLSIHTGGFVLASGEVADLVPIEPGRMADRTVIQWDKDDIDALGIFKVDLLGLGMLNVIARAFSMIERRGVRLALNTIPPDDRPTYEMIQRADTVGVFQIESRAQMGMLPRLKPACFYDLVIEVALVRPGPIQGGMVHPYLRRRRGEEPVEFPHPKLRPILARTLGVPIFQEQVMKMAVEVGGYTPGEADQLRRDMAAWRRSGKMKHHQQRLFERMQQNGIAEEYAQRIVKQIEGFASYGFPESHAAAFAHLVYVSAYLKCHFPAEFCCALVNAQPMGFYQVATLVSDAHRHGVPILPADVNHSEWGASLEPTAASLSTSRQVELRALRLGLRSVRGLAEEPARRIIAEREAGGGFASVGELAARCQLARKQLMQISLAGALGSIAERREAIWQSTALGARSFAGGNDLVANLYDEAEVGFQPMPAADELRLDHFYGSSFLEGHPIKLLRGSLRRRGVIRAVDLKRARSNQHVAVAGLVLVRQRPTGPGGVVFMALEDETGLCDIVLRPKTFEAHRTLICLAEMLIIHGRVQADGDARSLLASSLHNLTPEQPYEVRSRDFH